MLLSGGTSPIVNERKRDWLALDRKIRLGCPFDVAANLSGIPLEEALEYANSRLKNSDDALYQLRVSGQSALATAVERLTAIAHEDPRTRIERLKKAVDDTGMPDRVKVTLYNTDLDAAKALAKLAIDSIKLSGIVVKKEVAVTAAVDLFDSPGNWVLKKPG